MIEADDDEKDRAELDRLRGILEKMEAKLTKVDAKAAKQERRIDALKARRDAIAARQKMRDRKADLRRKIVVGAVVLNRARTDTEIARWLRSVLDSDLDRLVDKALFVNWQAEN